MGPMRQERRFFFLRRPLLKSESPVWDAATPAALEPAKD
jgi:hypothetical protein